MDKATLFKKFDASITIILIETYEEVKNILLNEYDINRKISMGRTLLMYFTYLREELALDLLNCQIPNLDLNIQDEYGQTALHCAVRKNNLELVQALLKYYE